MSIPRQTRLPLGAGDAYRAASQPSASRRSAEIYRFPDTRRATRPAARTRPTPVGRPSVWGALGADPLDPPRLHPHRAALQADLAPATRRWVWMAGGLAVAMLAPLSMWAAGWL